MTGIDAFAHAVESLTGGQANPLSDALARDAIHTITRWLPRAVEKAKGYITAAMEAHLDLGQGSGPLKHNYAIKEGGALQ